MRRLFSEVSLLYGALLCGLYCGEKEAALVGARAPVVYWLYPLRPVSLCFLSPQEQCGKAVSFLLLACCQPFAVSHDKKIIQYLHNIPLNSVYLNAAFEQSPSDVGAQRVY